MHKWFILSPAIFFLIVVFCRPHCFSLCFYFYSFLWLYLMQTDDNAPEQGLKCSPMGPLYRMSLEEKDVKCVILYVHCLHSVDSQEYSNIVQVVPMYYLLSSLQYSLNHYILYMNCTRVKSRIWHLGQYLCLIVSFYLLCRFVCLPSQSR